ncbi:MAG: hypothetical protein ACTHNU_09835, partial [Gaiellales bacterium]
MVDTHEHVFVTGLVTDSTIEVMSTSGSHVASITDEPSAGGMVLDGDNLYVAHCNGADVIDEFDTQTLAKIDSFPANVGGNCELALAGGRLWYSDSPFSGLGHLVSVSLDPSHTEVDSGRQVGSVDFATTPTHPNMLVVGDAYSDPPYMDVLDVTDPASVAVVTHNPDITNGGGSVEDMKISPDGSTLLLAAGSPYQIGSFSLPSLTAGVAYPIDPYPMAVAASPDGATIAGGSASYSNTVALFHTGSSTAFRKVSFGDAEIYWGGVAFSQDGKELFVVTKGATAAPVFHVVSSLPPGSLSIKA